MSFKSFSAVLTATLLITAIGCMKTDPPAPPATGDFTITIENVFEEKEFFISGATSSIDSSLSETFIVNARQGQHLSFMAGTNTLDDIFFSTPPNGIDLYPGGEPLDGNIASQIEFYDAGTVTDSGFFVELPITKLNTFNIEDFMELNVEHDGGTEFIFTIVNVFNNRDDFERIGEGAWVVHEPNQTPMFEEGADATDELIDLASSNSNNRMDVYLSENSGFVSDLAPGAYGFNDSLFFIQVKATNEMESLAEDGDPSGFPNVFDTPVGESSPGPLGQGQSYSFSFSATQGDFFSLAMSLVESNDWFIGANYIPLFHNNKPLNGEITSIMKVWDAGTEKDEFPGVGPNQVIRQTGNNTGPSEDGLIAKESDELYSIPEMSQMVKVTLSSN